MRRGLTVLTEIADVLLALVKAALFGWRPG